MTETTEQNPENELSKIIEDVISIRNNLPDEKLPEKIETGDVYSLADLYAEHAAMFEILSERLLNVELNGLNNPEIIKIRQQIEERAKKQTGDQTEIKDRISKTQLKELKKLSSNLSKNTQEMIDELIELKKIKKHIAVDRMRASNKSNKYHLIEVAQKKDEYNKSIEGFKGIKNSIHITDIHNDMYHFLLGMTEPIDEQPAFTLNLETPLLTDKKTGYKYPNLIYNPKFKGTITFGGDLIQSHDSDVGDSVGAIPLCLAMRNCMRQATYKINEEVGGYEKSNPPIVYVAGNHEMEALNEGQHPEVRTIMQEMFQEGLVKYCHYHYDEEDDTFISHTKLNKPLVELIGNDVDGYNELFEGEKPNRTLKKIDSKEQRQLLAKLLNENFDKHFEVGEDILFAPNPKGINDFAIVGEELERTYFRTEDSEDCGEAIEKFKEAYDDLSWEQSKSLKKLEILKNLALALKKSENKYGSNFSELKLSNGEEQITDNIKLIKKDEQISISSNGIIFSLKEAGELFAKAINSNPHSRPYSLMNRGALCNFSGGLLFGYEKDYPEEALNLGCNHIVGHRPTILPIKEEVKEGKKEKNHFISLNTPIATTNEKQTKKRTLQTDYNGKNEKKYVNCRITKFDENGEPHLVGISKILEKHREFFNNSINNSINYDININNKIKELFGDVYQEIDGMEEKQKEFVQYFKSKPPLSLEKKDLREYLENFGKQHQLEFKKSKLDESKLDEALKNFVFDKVYQEAFYRNRKKIIDKQEKISNKAKEQSQGQTKV